MSDSRGVFYLILAHLKACKVPREFHGIAVELRIFREDTHCVVLRERQPFIVFHLQLSTYLAIRQDRAPSLDARQTERLDGVLAIFLRRQQVLFHQLAHGLRQLRDDVDVIRLTRVEMADFNFDAGCRLDPCGTYVTAILSVERHY